MHPLLYFRQVYELLDHVSVKVRHHPLDLTTRYLQRISILDTVRQQEIVKLFAEFIKTNKDAIATRNVMDFTSSRIEISRKIYVDFLYMFEHCEPEMRDYIWTHLEDLLNDIPPEVEFTTPTVNAGVNPLEMIETMFGNNGDTSSMVQKLTQTMEQLLKPINENQEKINNPAMKSMVQFANEALKNLPILLSTDNTNDPQHFVKDIQNLTPSLANLPQLPEITKLMSQMSQMSQMEKQRLSPIQEVCEDVEQVE